ncbi:MAG: sugar phosphate nucleotidyltransferase [Nitrospirota bacterium]
MNRINAFILSAGLGERLMPVTEHIPKPLIPILGKPILEIVLEKVSALPVNKIGINLHHKKEEIEDWIERSAFRGKVEIFFENSILGTGGALKNAEGLLKDHTFLVHNSDILSDIDLESIVKSHRSSGNIATLAVKDHSEINNVIVGRDGTIMGIGKSDSTTTRQVTFTGIAVYSPEFLSLLPEGESSIVNGWLKAISSGKRVGTVDVSDSYPQDPVVDSTHRVDWRDIGTPETYLKAVFNTLRKEGETIFIHPTARVSENISLDGYVAVEEECVLGNAVSLKNTIILPGTVVSEGSYYEDCIVGSGYRIEVDLFRSTDKILIGTGGSDRNYYRMRRDKGSAVLMESQESDPDFERHIKYTLLFGRHFMPVPKLIKVNHDAKTALFEDLGDLTLYSWLKCPRKESEIESIYKSVIEILIILHTKATKNISRCHFIKDRLFNYGHLRWETDYFIERFVRGVKNIEIKDNNFLKEELHRLALKVDSFPKAVIHRDFQSQNVMVTKGNIPRIVDYQGARIGPPAYDLVSLLWDPYYRLTNTLREKLIDYYIFKSEENWEAKASPTLKPFSPMGRGDFSRPFRKTLLPCRLQRHMQALGAYGFLSMVKGKRYFLKYVPEGLKLLKEDIILSKIEYPKLYRLVMGL